MDGFSGDGRTPRRRINLTPRYTRYAAPTHRRATKAGFEATSAAVTPLTDAPTQMRSATKMPAAVMTALFRPLETAFFFPQGRAVDGRNPTQLRPPLRHHNHRRRDDRPRVRCVVKITLPDSLRATHDIPE
jgi:hypothetical protein